jgi:tetratricopeptide (TPR) repeat protein
MPRHHLSLVALALGILWPSDARANEASRTLTRDAYGLAYELRFAEGLALLVNARAADPEDPAPLRAVAAITWMEILFAQGVATFAAFDGDASSDVVTRPPVPPQLSQRFHAHMREAVRLAENHKRTRPHDADAQYQATASGGLLALYHGTVEGRAWAAFTEGRRAVHAMDALRERNGAHQEAALIPGIYRYAVSTLSWPKRVLAAAAGMAGDRDGGIRLLEMAAAGTADTATDASLVLMVVYNRENRFADAMAHLKRLQLRHPSNRLLRLNAAATALAAFQPAVAAAEITDTLPDSPTFDVPYIPGERALWLYTRGAARVALRHPNAANDLQQAILANPRDWVRARVHLELGRQALEAGDHRQAQADLDTALHYGHRGGDRTAIDSVKRLRQTGRIQNGRW